jgi:hypothetical protein
MRTIEVAIDNFIERSASAVECKGLLSQPRRGKGEAEHASAGSGCSVLGAWITR